jgi:hypothetical protein
MAQRQLLDRNGDVDKFQLSYDFYSEDKNHVVTPALTYVDRDLDGNAMANDGGTASVNYIYSYSDQLRYVFNASYGDFDWKEANPIYDQTDSANSYGISAAIFYTGVFGLKHWTLNATAAWYEEDHDIDFYDTSVGVIAVGMLRKF